MSNTSLIRHCMIVFASFPLGETRVQRESEALIKYGYEVDVICPRFPGELPLEEYKGIRIYRVRCTIPKFLAKRGGLFEKFLYYLSFFISAGIILTKTHLKKHYQIVQVHNLPDFLVFCAFIPKLMGSSIILDLHDLMPEFFAGRFGQNYSLGTRLILSQERLACRFADHVITVSDHWRLALISRGVPADKCSVVMNVADEAIFHPCNRAETLLVEDYSQKSFRLIYHGGMHARYGLDLALQAIDRLRYDVPEIHLCLIGDGEFVPYLKEMIANLNLCEYVNLEPLQIVEDLPRKICSCDLGIVPYRSDIFTDGLLPTKLMEYAAIGLPAIAARTTAIQAYFSDANVEFFEPGNVDDLARVIIGLYRNPKRLFELSIGCQKFNQKYNWTKIGADYVALVKRLSHHENPENKELVHNN
jgi:glycosyltransferase involved in cell wall biosynthesis